MYCDTGVLEMNIFILVSDFKACSCQKKMMKISQIYVTKKGLWQRANAWNISLEIVNGGLYVINSVCKTNFSCYTPTDVAQQFFSKLSPLLKKKKRKENGWSMNETYFRALTKKSGRELGLIPNDDSMSINVPESAFPFAYTEPLLTSFFTSVSKTFPVSSV